MPTHKDTLNWTDTHLTHMHTPTPLHGHRCTHGPRNMDGQARIWEPAYTDINTPMDRGNTWTEIHIHT
jgi:hypothetical protein